MCGHATIGVATTLFEEGLLEANGHSIIEFGLLTPAGRVALRARLREGRVEAVAFRTPFAFHLGSLEIEAAGRTRTVDLSYGGQWYAFIDLEGSGCQVDPNDIDELVEGKGDGVVAVKRGRLDGVTDTQVLSFGHLAVTGAPSCDAVRCVQHLVLERVQ